MDVRSSIEDLDEVTKQINVEIPAERVTKELEVAIANLSRTVKMKGFRPGKAPRHLIEKLHGDRVRYEVAQRLISNTLHDVVTVNKIHVVGSPELDVPAIAAGQELQYKAKVSVYPSPAISGYENFEITVPKKLVDEAAIDKVISNVLLSRATPKKIELREEARDGDVVELMLLVEAPGEEDTRPEPANIVLGEGKLPVELEKALVGAKVTEQREVTVTLPEDHAATSLRGKPVSYKATVVNISERITPELTEELVKELGTTAQTVAELREFLQKELSKDADRQLKSDARAKVLEFLLGKNEFTVPKVMVDEEIRSMIVRSGVIEPGAIESGRLDPANIPVEPFEAQFGDVARKRVRSAIIVDRVGDIEGIVASKEDEDKAFAEIGEDSNLPADAVRSFFQEKKRYGGFLLEVTRNKILDFLVDRATVTYEDKPYSEEKAAE